MADGTTTAASQDTSGRWRGDSATTTRPRLASSWVTMCTSILPDCCTDAAPMPSSKIRAHRDRREVPSTSWVAFISRAKSSSAVGTSSPTTVCRVAPRLAASSRTLPICGADTPASPSPRTTCTTISSALDFDAMRDARAHQRLRLRAAGHRDHDALAGLPGGGDVLVGAVLRQRGVDLVGQPQQRQLAQRGQVAGAEVVGQRRVDLSGAYTLPWDKPAPQRFRRDVDQLDLVGGAHHLVGHRLLLLDAGDLRDDVVEALQVLDVDGRDHGDAGVEQLLDVLPALGVPAARGVGVRQFVDQHHRGCRASTASTSSSANTRPRYSM